jgi:hypothetical protein
MDGDGRRPIPRLHNASASCATFAAAVFRVTPTCYLPVMRELTPVMGPVIFLLICSRRA